MQCIVFGRICLSLLAHQKDVTTLFVHVLNGKDDERRIGDVAI